MGDAVTSFVVKMLAQELNAELRGKFVQKVQQVGEKTFRITFSAPKRELIIEPGRRMHLTNYVVSVPEKASQIAMFLRKRIGGKRVERVYQHANDRIVVIEFSNGLSLIAEFFSHGNFVLADSGGVILFTMQKEEWKDRKLAKGEKYVFPKNLSERPLKEDYSPVTKEDVERKGVNAALDDYYSNARLVNPVVEKLKRRLALQEESLREFSRLAEESRAKGDAIYAAYARVSEIIESGKSQRGSGKKAKFVLRLD
ncbi:MAG: NFACT family protein [archaeon]